MPSTAVPLALVRAAHPRTAAATALGVALAAALSGRDPGAVALVAATVLVGQVGLGWHNDLVDRERDTRHDRQDKPLVRGTLDPDTLWFALACAVLLVVPLSVANGVVAGLSHLALLLVAGLANAGPLRWTALSWVPWAASYALWPAFLSYGADAAPTVGITVAAALLGIGAHVALALPGLVADHQDGRRPLPLRIALRTGAPRLRVLAATWLVGVVALAATPWLRP